MRNESSLEIILFIFLWKDHRLSSICDSFGWQKPKIIMKCKRCELNTISLLGLTESLFIMITNFMASLASSVHPTIFRPANVRQLKPTPADECWRKARKKKKLHFEVETISKLYKRKGRDDLRGIYDCSKQNPLKRWKYQMTSLWRVCLFLFCERKKQNWEILPIIYSTLLCKRNSFFFSCRSCRGKMATSADCFAAPIQCVYTNVFRRCCLSASKQCECERFSFQRTNDETQNRTKC